MLTCQNLSSRDLLVSTKVPTITILFVPELRLLLTFSRTVETKASAARRHPTQPGSHQYTAHRKYQTPSLLQHTDTFFQHRKLFDSSSTCADGSLQQHDKGLCNVVSAVTTKTFHQLSLPSKHHRSQGNTSTIVCLRLVPDSNSSGSLARSETNLKPCSSYLD
jgi:hypothetical protein